MSLLDALTGLDDAGTRRIHGVVTGIVTNNADPDKRGRVRVKFPWLSDKDESAWARVASFLAGDKRGAFFLPEVGDEVLVAFEHGDPAFPYVLGALWNGKDAPPATAASVRVLRSASGHTIRLDDTSGSEKIEIIDKTGDNRIVIDSKSGAVTISAPSGKLRLEGKEIEIEAKGAIKVRGSTIDLN